MPRLSPEQIAARTQGLGSTDLVEVALSAKGLVPWAGASPMRVYCRKKGLIAEDEPTPEQEWGHWQEELLLRWYEHSTGNETLPGGHIPHPTEPWLWATIDAKAIGEPRIVECKNVGRWMTKGWDENLEDGVPHHVRAQAVIACACARAKEVDIVASIAGMPAKVWRIPYDAELADMLINVGRKFWHENVLADVAPELDDTSATRAYLDAKYPKELAPVILDATPEQVEIGLRLQQTRTELNYHKHAEALAYAELLEQVGTASGLRCEQWQITWRSNKSGKRTPRFTSRGEVE